MTVVGMIKPDVEVLSQLPVIEVPLKGKLGAGKVALMDGDYDGEWLSQYPWYMGAGGFVVVGGPGMRVGPERQWIYLHHFILPDKPGYIRYHLNGNKLDNRSCNLGYATKKERAAMRETPAQAARPYRGVQRYTRTRNGKRYISRSYSVQVNSRYVGSYPTPEAAAMAYDEAAYNQWGDAARLNFPDAL